MKMAAAMKVEGCNCPASSHRFRPTRNPERLAGACAVSVSGGVAEFDDGRVAVDATSDSALRVGKQAASRGVCVLRTRLVSCSAAPCRE
jgi:hypothetical protein